MGAHRWRRAVAGLWIPVGFDPAAGDGHGRSAFAPDRMRSRRSPAAGIQFGGGPEQKPADWLARHRATPSSGQHGCQRRNRCLCGANGRGIVPWWCVRTASGDQAARRLQQCTVRAASPPLWYGLLPREHRQVTQPPRRRSLLHCNAIGINRTMVGWLVGRGPTSGEKEHQQCQIPSPTSNLGLELGSLRTACSTARSPSCAKDRSDASPSPCSRAGDLPFYNEDIDTATENCRRHGERCRRPRLTRCLGESRPEYSSIPARDQNTRSTVVQAIRRWRVETSRWP